ncbi:FMN-dependent NADH-azoreductase [Flavobacterium sp.]|uniref:FMN-dependent NADH-azoreductase n=1 Tax=Flavobacterium sp. TaxID=239 RepID=UPI0037532B6A
MKNILQINSSLMGNQSYSIKLSQAIVEKIKQKNPEHKLEVLDLVETQIPHLTPRVLQSFFIPNEQLTEEHKQLAKLSNELVKQLLANDIIVIGAPLYNFTIPTQLKAWIDHITRAGITFGYGENGTIGLLKGKKVYVAMTSGGVYSDDHGKDNDFVAPYLKAFFGFLGMTDITVYKAEGLKIPGLMEHALEKAIDSIAID